LLNLAGFLLKGETMSPETPPSLPKPKRGAPLGNKNRFVHGAYARRPEPAPDPDSAPTYPSDRLSLVNEIAILRAYILRTALVGAITLNLDQTQKLLHTLSLAATSLTRLIQTEAYLSQAAGTQVQADNFPWMNTILLELTNSILPSKPVSPEDEAADSESPDAEPADIDPQMPSLLEQTGLDPASVASFLPICSNPGPKLPSGPSNPTAGHPPSLEPPVDQ